MKWGRRQEQPHSGGIPAPADRGQPSHPSMFLPPEPFADRYTALHLLGRGGFGDVYRAWDTQMERQVALKLLKRDLALDADWRRRFRQEATRNLLHPNITINFDIGDYQEQPFIVMELVEGDPLSRVIERRIPLTDVERLSLIEQLCDGLHYAHTQQVIHRDIKPANLMVCEKPQGNRMVRTLKILDFGISKVVSTEETSTSSFMFSPPYVSPEQVRGEHADERSDMFAVGTVAYELLSYQKAFDIRSKNLFEILNEVRRKNAEEPHRPLLEIRPDIDPQLSAIIDRALAKRPDDRFSSLAVMGRQLRGVRERLEDQLGEDSSPTLVLSPTVQTTVREAREALEAGDPTAALGKLEHALALHLSRAERRLLEEISADARERHYQKSGARHQHDRAAVAEAIEWARTVFANGQRTVAIDRLSRFEPVELVVDELETLRATKAALAHAERAVNAGTPTEGREAIDRLERSCRPELIEADVVRLRQLADARPAADDEVWEGGAADTPYDVIRGDTDRSRERRSSGAYRRILLRAGMLILATGAIAFSAYRWWPGSEPRRDSPGPTSSSADPSAGVRQQILDLWSQDRRIDALDELGKAINRWPQDQALIQVRERLAGEAVAASEQARQQAENAGAASDELFKGATASTARANAHASNGRHVDSIRAYLDAANNYNRALKNAGPVAEVDAYLKAGDRLAALDALVRGLEATPDNALLRQRFDRLRGDALKSADSAHQELTRQKSFDQIASDYQAARQAYDAAKSRTEPDAIRVLLGLPARFKAAREKMSEAAALHTRGLEQARADQQQGALSTLRDARARFPAYRATRQLGRDLRESASELAQRAKKAAAGAGPNAQTSAAFAEALKAEQLASQATTDEAAIESWHKATDLFVVAEKEGRKTPPATPPAPGPPGGSSGRGGNVDTRKTPAPPEAVEKPTTTPSPTEPKPPGPTNSPVRRDRAAEEEEISATIEQYKRGYREMNPDIIRSVYPTFSKERQRELQRQTDTCKAYPVELDGMKTQFSEGAEGALVTARARYGCVPKRGGRIDYSDAQTEFFRLERVNGRWVITDMPGR